MAQPIRFLLNGEAHSVADAAPTTTVLDWLRADAGLTGTKEGCAEGDCGACTVVVVDVAGRDVRYRAVNACIALLAQLDGRALLTVEGLKGPDGDLHPVQRALVETHGSQCGFCTPGFVMALFAFHHGNEPADEALIHDMLAGNLCRCTGYRPIVEAARRVAGGPADRFSARARELAGSLQRLAPGDVFAHGGQRYFAPRDLDALLALIEGHSEAVIWAGGTDLGLLASKERRHPEIVVSVARVAELCRIAETDTHLEIGAAVTYTDALPAIEPRYPALAALIRRVGSRQIRNFGTIGGNIANASPVGDMPPCLIALDATVVLRSARGRRELPVEDFFVDYRQTALAAGEVIEAVRIPRLAPAQSFHCDKVSKRFDQDISAVIGAYRLELDGDVVTGVRMAYGGMAATPKRATACEAALIGRPWTEATVAAGGVALARDFAAISDFRASADYRMTVAANLLRRLHLRTTRPDALAEVAAL